MNFLSHRVNFSVGFGYEEALDATPKAPDEALVFLFHVEELDGDVGGFYDGVGGEGGGELCELLDPLFVIATVEEDVLPCFHLIIKRNN